MTIHKSLQESDIAWLKVYSAEVSDLFRAKFKCAGKRFKDSERLINRFTNAVEMVFINGRTAFRAVDEAHNELCITSALLSNSNPEFTHLDYEPILTGCTKSIDFRAMTNDGLTVYVDVKTINPQHKDRWRQFETALKEGWLPNNVNVMLSKQWLGGEFWHSMFAARSRMLEYSLELEQKILDGMLESENTFFVLALCGEGFNWHEDELEDFVSFYYTGFHRSDDPFSKAEDKYIEDKKITIGKSITRFACMRRSQGDILHKRLNWHVRPPNDSNFAWT